MATSLGEGKLWIQTVLKRKVYLVSHPVKTYNTRNNVTFIFTFFILLFPLFEFRKGSEHSFNLISSSLLFLSQHFYCCTLWPLSNVSCIQELFQECQIGSSFSSVQMCCSHFLPTTSCVLSKELWIQTGLIHSVCHLKIGLVSYFVVCS